ncbi:MAG: FtsK/SpoIIIE domain-containing protein [Dermatophilus congolensis]|nr:FtsK/SpoIIIE domain-containing protein [Dermatophilus congolensis]
MSAARQIAAIAKRTATAVPWQAHAVAVLGLIAVVVEYHETITAILLMSGIVLALITAWSLRLAGSFRAWLWLWTWPRLARGCDLVEKRPSGEIQVPRIQVRGTKAAASVLVRPVAGTSVKDYRRAGEAIGCAWRAPVRIREADAGKVELRALLRDPWASSNFIAGADQVQVADDDLQAVVGIREDGSRWLVPLDRSVFVGGEPGSGKSSFLAALIGSVISRPEVALVLLDMKGGVELGVWEPRASAFAETTDEATQVLRALEEIRVRRMSELRAAGLVSARDLGYSRFRPLLLTVVDEVAEVCTPESPSKEDKDLAAERVRLLSRLARLGRAAGIVMVPGTQKPTADAVPTQIRDACPGKIAFRCATDEQARASLGDSAREDEQITPTRIRREQRGVAVTDCGDGPEFVRAWWVPEEVRKDLATRHRGLATDLEQLLPPRLITLEGDVT